MPAIITHDSFGQDVYKNMYTTIGESRDEYEAFLLGNQGPDPLFFSVLVPRLYKYTELGSLMHDKKPNEVLVAFKQSLSVLSDQEVSIGRAYLAGFLCHFLLDSNMHPLVFNYEHQLCDAGVEELDRKDGHEVHAVIESELDEMVLYTKRGVTVATFNPATQILRASDFVLDAISKMYVYVAMTVYGEFIPKDMFKSSVKSYRRATAAFHSKTGMKRAIVGQLEQMFRRHSFFRSMSPRALEIEESLFDNRDHATWENPFTNECSTKSFWDIYEETLTKAQAYIKLVNADIFDLKAAQSITHDLDFSGQPTVAMLTVEEDR